MKRYRIATSSRYVAAHSVEIDTFSTVGHAFFALIVGLIGAFLGYSLGPKEPAKRAAGTSAD